MNAIYAYLQIQSIKIKSSKRRGIYIMTETNNFNTNNKTITKNQNDDTLVKDLVEGFKLAFNSHDPKTLGSVDRRCRMDRCNWTYNDRKKGN